MSRKEELEPSRAPSSMISATSLATTEPGANPTNPSAAETQGEWGDDSLSLGDRSLNHKGDIDAEPEQGNDEDERVKGKKLGKRSSALDEIDGATLGGVSVVVRQEDDKSLGGLTLAETSRTADRQRGSMELAAQGTQGTQGTDKVPAGLTQTGRTFSSSSEGESSTHIAWTSFDVMC